MFRFIEADFELHPINPLADESSGVQLFGFGEFGRGLTDRFAVAKPVSASGSRWTVL